jgi:hypothetical protein
MRTGLPRILLVAIAGLAAGAAPASAAITVGQTAPGATTSCGPNLDEVGGVVSSGNSYTVPSPAGVTNWTMTSWSTNANATPGTLTLKVFHAVNAITVQAVSHDGPRSLTPGGLNTFSTNLPVKAGDIIGLHNTTNGVGCIFPATATDFRGVFSGDLADGQTGTVSLTGGARVNVSAQLEPTNTFTLGTTTRNHRNGSAIVAFDVPNPGELTATGNGVSASSAHSSAPAFPGNAQLVFQATGKKKKKLRSKGKVTLAPTVTYTPIGGAPKSLAVSVLLKKKRKKK